jgi:hypothetical protein
MSLLTQPVEEYTSTRIEINPADLWEQQDSDEALFF